MALREFRVNIAGLSNKLHNFQFEVGDDFFGSYGTGLISHGQFRANVDLDKHETFIEARFHIHGHARLICDRSLDPFEHPIDADKRIVFKFGDADQELSDDIIMIHRDSDSLELGQHIYEFIALEIPIKKLHPRYQHEADDNAEGKIIYSSESGHDEDGEDIDPRWEQLKKLK